MSEPIHVDDFIDDYRTDAYASFVLFYFRCSAVVKAKFEPFMRSHELFCDYDGKSYRVTGASRLGDVWLATDPTREIGYDLRVDVAKCSRWRRSV